MQTISINNEHQAKHKGFPLKWLILLFLMMFFALAATYMLGNYNDSNRNQNTENNSNSGNGNSNNNRVDIKIQ